MSELFKQNPKKENAPLADILRPQSLKDYIGQEHLVGENKPLRLAIEKKHLFSHILWGPPGTGKTTLARIYANELDAKFEELSAVSAKKEDIKKILDKHTYSDKPLIIFLDEIHRFNKAQQDFLLPYVESGQITLIGATTENPSFEVIGALLSRARVFVLNEHSDEDIRDIIKNGAKHLNCKIDKKAQDWLINMANGDARQAISMLEATANLYKTITEENLRETLQNSHLRYDKKGEEHYNTISAYIKSMRASNVDAALYYLARMVESGEDPKFIARRMVIFASEDIGIANNSALIIANEVFSAVEKIGYPECTINLAHGTVVMCKAKKDRRSYDGIKSAMSDVKRFGNLAIPLKLRNAVTGLMKKQGYGDGYEMYGEDDLLPDKLKGKKYFR